MLLCVPNLISCQEECNISTAQSYNRKFKLCIKPCQCRYFYLLCAYWHTKRKTISYINLRVMTDCAGIKCLEKKPEIARNSAEWQMTRVRFLLLAVTVMLSITHINLAGTRYVLQGNNINICKLNLEVLYMIYLNKMAVCFGKYYKHHFFPVSRILKLCFQTADLPLRSPPPRNLTLLVCTLLKSTVFWELVRQSLFWGKAVERSYPLSPPSLALSHLSYMLKVLAQNLYISLSAQFVFVWNTHCWFDFY